MALRNGILVHSLSYWAAAVRTDDGEIKLASGRKAGHARRGLADAAPARRRADGGGGPPAPDRAAAPARGAAAGRGAGDGCGAGRLGAPRTGRAAEPAPSGRRRVACRRGGACPRAHGAPRLRDRGLPRRRAQGDRRVRAGHRRGRCLEGARALRVAHGRPDRRRSRPPATRLRAGFRSRAAGRPGSRSAWRRSVRRPRRSAGWGAIASTRSPARCDGPGSSSSGSPRPASRRAAELEVAEAALGEVLRLEGVQTRHVPRGQVPWVGGRPLHDAVGACALGHRPGSPVRARPARDRLDHPDPVRPARLHQLADAAG